jgi:hypothetical protein
MTEFSSVDMQPGEQLVFGPVTSTKTTTVSGGTGPAQGGVSRTVGRTVGVTNRRVIIEDTQNPANSTVIPNDQVQKVIVKRKKKGEQESITIAKIETATGSSIKVDLPGIDAHRESQLGETFPNAEISQASGLSTGVIIALVVAGLAVLCCLAVTFGPVIAGFLTMSR